MGFRKSNIKHIPQKLPKKDIRLTFGIVEDKNAINSNENLKNNIPKPFQFEKQEIIGTLILKKVDIDSAKPLTEKYIERIKNNLSKLYEEGRFLSTANIVDSDLANILKITFNYNQSTIDRLRGLDRNERNWDPENKCWHVFIGCFDDVFDILGRGIKLTENAYKNLLTFIHSKYYANIAPSKLGKLLIRESWFEEFDLTQHRTQKLGSDKENSENEVKLTSFQKDLFEKTKKQVAEFKFQRTPYSHQTKGIEFLLLNPNCALLDEMGCGKSFQIASCVAILLQNKMIERCLIICPKSLVRTWKEELTLATNIPYNVVEGTPAERLTALKSSAKIFIIHYEGVRLEKEALAHWVDSASTMVVFDESQRIKNINSQTTISSKYVRNHAKRCVIATGTPIANRPLDLFAQYFVMDNGATFGTNFQAFKNTFCYTEIIEIPQGRRKIKIEKFLGVRNSDELRRRIEATSLRRLKSEVLDLPPIVYKDYSVELKNEQKAIYAKVRDNVRNEIENMTDDEIFSRSGHLLVKLLRLSQIASNPSLIDKKYDGSCSKLEELDDILDDVFSDENKKVILWSHFIDNVKLLQEKYVEKYSAVAHTGEMNLDGRTHSIKEFQDNPACRLFIATPQSAKEGLTLLPKDGKMRADTMIYLDLNFDAGSYIQSQARFHRIGQTSDKCLVIHLVAVGTVDEYIKETVMDKVKTASKILDNFTDENLKQFESSSFNLSKKDVLDILSKDL